MKLKLLLQRIAKRRLDLALALVIFALTVTIFLLSPMIQYSDSQYTLVLSESLIRYRSFALDHFALPRLEPKDNGLYVRNGEIYQQEWSQGRLYYYHPPGSSVLSVPYVAVMHKFGLSSVNPDGTHNLENEMHLQAYLAAILMALAAAMFYLSARLLLPAASAAIVSLAAAFCTPVWSTLSRGLWSDTWAVLLFSIIVLMLLADAAERLSLNPIALATLLAWTYFVRPTSAIAIIAVTVYVVWYRRKIFLPYAAVGLIWFIGFVIYSRTHFGTWLPSYYRASRLSLENFGEALAGHLISPSRGLFIFVPILLFVGYLIARYHRTWRFRGLVWLALGIALGQWLANSAFPHWWGGFCYGPRLMTGLMPWFVLLAILGIDAMRRAPADTRFARLRVPQIAGVSLLLLVSLAMNGIGATLPDTAIWNERPIAVDKDPGRLWSWRYPQFLAAFIRPPLPREFPPSDVRIEFSRRAAEPYLWYGWSVNEPEYRWTAAREAAMVFEADASGDAQLTMKVAPLLVKNKLPQQRVSVYLNDHLVKDFTLTTEGARELSASLPKELMRTNNTLVFKLPDAHSPKSVGLNPDPRILALAVFWIEIRTAGGAKNSGRKSVSSGRLPQGGYSARIEALNAPANLRSGESFDLKVRVENTSGAIWRSESEGNGAYWIRLGNHWLDENGKRLQTDDGRTSLPYDIRPGTAVEMVLTVKAPATAGEYILELDMVQEKVSWFANEESQPVRIKVTVSN